MLQSRVFKAQPIVYTVIGLAFFIVFSQFNTAFSQPSNNTKSVTNWTGSTYYQSKENQLIKSLAKIPMSEALTNAINGAGGNSLVQSALLATSRGFLIYDIFLIDNSNQFHHVIVDAGDGRILSNTLLTPGSANKTSTSTASTTPTALGCFERPCPPVLAMQVSTTGNLSKTNSTALIGISINASGLQDLRKHTADTKSALLNYVNKTLDSLATSNVAPRTTCFSVPGSSNNPALPGGPHNPCPIIYGIILLPCQHPLPGMEGCPVEFGKPPPR